MCAQIAAALHKNRMMRRVRAAALILLKTGFWTWHWKVCQNNNKQSHAISVPSCVLTLASHKPSTYPTFSSRFVSPRRNVASLSAKKSAARSIAGSGFGASISKVKRNKGCIDSHRTGKTGETFIE